MALILDGNGLIQGLSAGGLPNGSIDADSLASTLDLSSKTMTFGNVTASGITFPASVSASGNPNTLDDYEEGTWTPIVNRLNGGWAGTYTTQTGVYRKIGSFVWLYGFITINTISNASADTNIIQGFPFIPSGYTGVGSVSVTSALTTNAKAIRANDTGGFRFVALAGGEITENWVAGGTIEFSIGYYVT